MRLRRPAAPPGGDDSFARLPLLVAPLGALILAGLGALLIAGAR